MADELVRGALLNALRRLRGYETFTKEELKEYFEGGILTNEDEKKLVSEGILIK